MLPCFLLWKDGSGIFNVCNDLSVWCAREGKTGTDDLHQRGLGRTEKPSVTLLRPGVEPWPRDLQSIESTNQPRTPVVALVEWYFIMVVFHHRLLLNSTARRRTKHFACV